MTKLVKKLNRKADDPQLPKLGKVFRASKGYKFASFLRDVFEYKTIRRILGTNIAFLIISTSIIPANTTVSAVDKLNLDPQAIEAPLIISTQKGIRYPVNTVRQTQGYSFYHPGLDLDGVTGDPIYPIMSGKISVIEQSKFAYGNSIIVDHGNGISSRYAHLSKINVRIGDIVTNDTQIGEMGATGRSFGDHLHLEIYENGRAINPVTILPKQAL